MRSGLVLVRQPAAIVLWTTVIAVLFTNVVVAVK